MLRQIPSLQRTAPRLLPISISISSSRPLILRTPTALSSRSLSTSTSTSTSEASAPSPAEAPSAPQSPPPRQPLSYLVSRTPSNNLSVYNLAKSGGTQKLTAVKKIAGDARALRREMVAELGFPAEQVNINPVTGHINVKGWHQEKIKAWLEARGF